MAWTLTDLSVLESAIATGANKVKYGDKEVEYRSLEEMNQVRQQIRDELGLNGTNPNAGRRKFATFSKGLD
jgi:hypothetical protein